MTRPTLSTVESGPARVARRRRRRLLPPQHGAWAMLAVPFAAGLIVAGYRWPDLPLLGAWIAGYPLSYFALQAAKTRGGARRYRVQLLVYGPVTGLLGAVALLARPALLGYAPVYLVLLAVNLGYALRRRERALVNDLASVAQSCLMVFVVATVAAAPPAAAAPAFALCLAYFAGTVPYVKTMIRERGDRRYRRASVAYHLVALGLAAWLGPWAAVLFGWLLARAWWLPARPLRPRTVGLIEIANSAALLAVIALVAAVG